MLTSPATVPSLTDLRRFVAALDEAGELHRVDTPVSLDLELGAVIRHSYELRAAAPLFTRVQGVPSGYRVLGAPAGLSSRPGQTWARAALAVGLPVTATASQIVRTLAAGHDVTPIPPRLVGTGPCQEVVETGDDVDLTRFPAPLLHYGDGGRYLNTYGIVVARTPDGGWTNWSVTRVMLHDRTRLTGLVGPLQHLGAIHRMWSELGRDTPVAIAIGAEPAVPFAGATPLPAHVDEGGYAGAVLGRPVDVVRCRSNSLRVPAGAEIVLEGTLSRDRTLPEGPMGEYGGYVTPRDVVECPVYDIACVTHRRDPILPVVVAGEPPEENHVTWGLAVASEALHRMRVAGLPVTMAFSPVPSAMHWLAVGVHRDWRCTTRMTNAELVTAIGRLVFEESRFGGSFGRVLVMADDVDVTDPEQVLWAFATRNHPEHGEYRFPGPDHLPRGEPDPVLGTRVAHDCLPARGRAGDRPRRTALTSNYPQEIVGRVLDGWSARYGYPPP